MAKDRYVVMVKQDSGLMKIVANVPHRKDAVLIAEEYEGAIVRKVGKRKKKKTRRRKK